MPSSASASRPAASRCVRFLVPLLRQLSGAQVNINSWTRDPYLEELRKGITNGEPMPQTIDKATDAFGREAIRHFKLYGSAGKA
jgi:hypothetical protein